MPVVVVAFDFEFNGGSMGYAVGERFTRVANRALEEGTCVFLCDRRRSECKKHSFH